MESKKLALIVGINDFDVSHYGPNIPPLRGCENDARDMRHIVEAQGFVVTMLTGEDAKARRVLEEIAVAAAALDAGDTFLLFLATHGSRIPAVDTSETDGKTEVVLFHDQMLSDKELLYALAAFGADVEVKEVLDVCFSAGLARDDLGARNVRRVRSVPEDVAAQVFSGHASTYRRMRGVGDVESGALLFAACAESETAGDLETNGAFTAALKAVWADGAFTGDWNTLCTAVGDRLVPWQHPELIALTDGARRIGKQHPFALTGREDLDNRNDNNQKEITMTEVMNQAPAPLAGHSNRAAVVVPQRDDDGWAEYVGAAFREGVRFDRPLVDPLAGVVGEDAVRVVSEQSGARPIVPVRSRAEGITVSTTWWGFYVDLDHTTLQDVLNSTDVVNSLAGLVGQSLPINAGIWVRIVAGLIEASSAKIRSLDIGYGVRFAMSWAALGVAVPITLRPGRGIGTRDVPVLLKSPIEFEVRRTGGEVDTGIVIETGQRLVLRAWGSVWSGVFLTGLNGPAGWQGWKAGPDCRLSEEPPFSAIGSLGGRWFYIGEGRELVHEGAPSKLVLGINARERNGDGAFYVRVEVWSA